MRLLVVHDFVAVLAKMLGWFTLIYSMQASRAAASAVASLYNYTCIEDAAVELYMQLQLLRMLHQILCL